MFLSITPLREVAESLIPVYGAYWPVAVVHKATCPDQKIVLGTLSDILGSVCEAGIKSQSMVLVGRVLNASDFARP